MALAFLGVHKRVASEARWLVCQSSICEYKKKENEIEAVIFVITRMLNLYEKIIK